MLAPTHSVFGIFSTLIILAVFGVSVSMHWTIIAFAVFGAILPDIDHPKSTIGRAFRFISIPLERKYGHRTVTHSIIGWFVASILFTLCILPVYFIPQVKELFPNYLLVRWIAAFSIGYFSHIVLDMLNKRGSQLLWPDTGRDVLPGNEKFRIKSGSKVELVIFFVLLILMIFSFPLSKYGLASSLRWLLATPASAIEEYKTMKNHTFLEFEGMYALTKAEVIGIGEILDVVSNRLLIMFEGNIYTLSDEYVADITSFKVRVKHTDKPIKIVYKTFKNFSLEALLAQVPDKALVSGIVNLPKDIIIKFEYLNTVPVTFKTIKQKGDDLILNFASKDAIKRLTFDDSYDLLQRKDKAEINFLFYKSQMIKAEMQDIRMSGDGLTTLGRDLLLSKEEKALRDMQIKELENSLHKINLDIEEIQQRIDARKFIFSGEVRIRE